MSDAIQRKVARQIVDEARRRLDQTTRAWRASCDALVAADRARNAASDAHILAEQHLRAVLRDCGKLTGRKKDRQP